MIYLEILRSIYSLVLLLRLTMPLVAHGPQELLTTNDP